MSRTLNLVDCLLTSARNLHRLGRADDALDILRRLVRFRNMPADAAAEAHSLLAKLYFKQDDYRKARRHLVTALTFQTHCADFHFRLALAIEADPEARPDRARGHYVRALQLDKKNAHYWLDYGLFLLTLEDRQRGLRALRRAYALASSDPDILSRVAEGLRQEGLADEARIKILAVLFQQPRDRRYRALWQEHQFQMLYERQQQQRRERTAAVIAAPVLLPFEPVEAEGRYVGLGSKILRFDRPAKLSEPKTSQRKPYRRPM
jgi:tetratricopeptide (TPR) repeat protein